MFFYYACNNNKRVQTFVICDRKQTVCTPHIQKNVNQKETAGVLTYESRYRENTIGNKYLLRSNTVMAVVPDSNRISFYIYSAYNFSNRISFYIRFFVIITSRFLFVKYKITFAQVPRGRASRLPLRARAARQIENKRPRERYKDVSLQAKRPLCRAIFYAPP